MLTSSNNQISESPIFTTKFCYLIFCLMKSRTNSQQRHLKVPQKNVFHKKINEKVNEQNNRNSENWLFDDVSEIIVNIVIHLYDVLRKFKSIHYLNFLSMFRNGKYKLKFMLPKKATKMDEIFTVDLTLCRSVKLTVKISSIFVAFLENTNFKLGQNIFVMYW